MGEKTSLPDNFVSRSNGLIQQEEDRIFCSRGRSLNWCCSFLNCAHPHCIIIAVEVEAFTAGLAASMTILAHEINRILSTVAAVQMCMMIFMIICFSISDLNPNLLFLHLFTSVERF